MNNSFKETQEITNLKQKQLTSIQEKASHSRESMQSISSDWTTGKKTLELLEKRYVRDDVGAAEVETARSRVKELENQLADAERMNKLVNDALAEIGAEINQAEQKLFIEKRDYVLGEKARIGESLNADAKIRAQLMAAYAAMLSNPQGHNRDWRLFITSIFTSAPSQIEIDTAIAAFSQKHGLDH